MSGFSREGPAQLSLASQEHINAAQLLCKYLSSTLVARPARGVGENRWMITYVTLVSALAMAQTARYIYLTYIISVLHRDIFTVKSRFFDPLFNAALSDLAKVFFIYRTYKITHSIPLLIILCIIQALITASQVWVVIGVHAHPEVRYITKDSIAFNIATISSLVFDLVLTSILCYGLFKSRTGIKYLDRFITRIILFFWTCAIPPSFAMIPVVVIYNVVPNPSGSAWCGFCLATSGKLYCHALLRSLNSRDRFSDKLSHVREAINEEYGSSSFLQPFAPKAGGPTESSFSSRHSNQTGSAVYADKGNTRSHAISTTKNVVTHLDPPCVSEEVQTVSGIIEVEATPEARARLNPLISALEHPKVEEWRSNV